MAVYLNKGIPTNSCLIKKGWYLSGYALKILYIVISERNTYLRRHDFRFSPVLDLDPAYEDSKPKFSASEKDLFIPV